MEANTKGKKKSKLVWIIIGVVVFLIAIGIGTNTGSSNDEYVKLVKEGKFKLSADLIPSYELMGYSYAKLNQKTISEAFNAFFGSPRWESLEHEGKRYVSFYGNATVMGSPAKVSIQWEVGNNDFTLNAFEVNGQAQANMWLFGLLSKIYEE